MSSPKDHAPIGQGGSASADKELPLLLPDLIGGVEVSADSGVIEFQIGVPTECVFDDVENRVSGVIVEPLHLKPGLHNIYLHFYDLFSNSIVVGDLRLSDGHRVHVLPFHLRVGNIERDSFSHTQAFSDEEKHAWGIETVNVGVGVWTKLADNFLATLPDLERRASTRPCTRTDLENLKEELDSSVTLLRKRREELRVRSRYLPDPPQMAESIHRVRAVLRKSFAQYAAASSVIRHLRELVDRGHIRRAVSAAWESRKSISAFSDLSLNFVLVAESEFHRRRKRLRNVGILLGAGITLVAIAIKLTQAIGRTP